MCTLTVTFQQNNWVFTSNRDDLPQRASLDFRTFEVNGKSIYYPEDFAKKGTWIACDNLGNIVVLLNGAHEKHEKLPHYTNSRGFIPLDIIKNDKSFTETIKNIDLQNTEPFTLVAFENKILQQFIWNGTHLSHEILNTSKVTKYIWSSVTLYNSKIRNIREKSFNDFHTSEKSLHPENQKQFLMCKTDDLENGFIIHRNNQVQTLSTTQIILSAATLTISFNSHIYNFTKSLFVKLLQ